MKVHVVSDTKLRVGVSDPDPNQQLGSEVERCLRLNGFVVYLNLTSRGVQFIGTYYQAQSKIQNITMSMFNDTERTKNGNTEKCLHNVEEVVAFATTFTLSLLFSTESTWWNADAYKPLGEKDIVAFHLAHIFKCLPFPPTIFPAPEPLSLGQR